MKTKGLKIAGCILLGILAVAGFSAAVMLLWNAIVPSIFGLGVISFWQALGLLVLIRILFGGFGHGKMHRFAAAHGGMHGRNHIREKWMKMSPEERDEFMKRRKDHLCGGHFGHGHGFDRGHGFDQGHGFDRGREHFFGDRGFGFEGDRPKRDDSRKEDSRQETPRQEDPRQADNE